MFPLHCFPSTSPKRKTTALPVFVLLYSDTTTSTLCVDDRGCPLTVYSAGETIRSTLLNKTNRRSVRCSGPVSRPSRICPARSKQPRRAGFNLHTNEHTHTEGGGLWWCDGMCRRRLVCVVTRFPNFPSILIRGMRTVFLFHFLTPMVPKCVLDGGV